MHSSLFLYPGEMERHERWRNGIEDPEESSQLCLTGGQRSGGLSQRKVTRSRIPTIRGSFPQELSSWVSSQTGLSWPIIIMLFIRDRLLSTYTQRD